MHKKLVITGIIALIGIAVYIGFVLNNITDLEKIALNEHKNKWENELYSFELPNRFRCLKHVHAEGDYKHEYGFFGDGKAMFYFAYNNLGAGGPVREDDFIDESKGIAGWEIIKDSTETYKSKQFYNIPPPTNNDWTWGGVYLVDKVKFANHEILFVLSSLNLDRISDDTQKHQIDKKELQSILSSVKLK